MHLSASVRLDLPVKLSLWMHGLLAVSGNRTAMYTLHDTLCSSCIDASRAVFVGKVSERTR